MNRLREKVSGNKCSVCQYPVPDKFLKEYRGFHGVMIEMCDLCRNTRDIDDDTKAHMNFCTNAVLDQMGVFNE